jgi:hypothetical protein
MGSIHPHKANPLISATSISIPITSSSSKIKDLSTHTNLQKIANFSHKWVFGKSIYLPEKAQSVKMVAEDGQIILKNFKYHELKKENYTSTIIRIILLATIILPIAAAVIVYMNNRINAPLDDLSKEQKQKLWSEKIESTEHIYKMLFPRLLASSDLGPTHFRFEKILIMKLSMSSSVLTFSVDGYFSKYREIAEKCLVIYINEDNDSSLERFTGEPFDLENFNKLFPAGEAFILNHNEIESSNTILDSSSAFYRFLKDKDQ